MDGHFDFGCFVIFQDSALQIYMTYFGAHLQLIGKQLAVDACVWVRVACRTSCPTPQGASWLVPLPMSHLKLDFACVLSMFKQAKTPPSIRLHSPCRLHGRSQSRTPHHEMSIAWTLKCCRCICRRTDRRSNSHGCRASCSHDSRSHRAQAWRACPLPPARGSLDSAMAFPKYSAATCVGCKVLTLWQDQIMLLILEKFCCGLHPQTSCKVLRSQEHVSGSGHVWGRIVSSQNNVGT